MAKTRSRSIGDVGESIAAQFLIDRGLEIVDRNVFVDGDEIDIIYRGEDGLIAVEVKTVTNGGDPLESFTEVKMQRVRRASSGYGRPVRAIDAVGVSIGESGVEVRWLRGVV
ncbi:MAG: YraN family protein [Actinomycetota bacterium]